MYTEKTFTIGTLEGISEKTITEHKKLYAGYVKHANLIEQKIAELEKDAEANAYTIGELRRRFGFEFDGMRNHEHYFNLLEGGSKALDASSPLAQKITEQFGSIESWQTSFTRLAMTRGVGWAMLGYDHDSKSLVHAWVEEQHLGHLNNVSWIIGLDMWEHSYMLDYVPSEKKNYITAFFKNLNWENAHANFIRATSK